MATTSDARQMLQHENELINQRMLWLSSFQAILIAATSFLWGKPDTAYVVLLICFLGIALSVVTLVGLIGATGAQNSLIVWWEDNVDRSIYTGPGIIPVMPGRFRRRLRYLSPWHFIPVLFIAAWIAIAVHQKSLPRSSGAASEANPSSTPGAVFKERSD